MLNLWVNFTDLVYIVVIYCGMTVEGGRAVVISGNSTITAAQLKRAALDEVKNQSENRDWPISSSNMLET